jgi:hypothetical protein
MRPLLRILNVTLLYSHRWLGIAGCVLFIAWFFSGIVMMYARMPEVASEERLARAAPLDLSAVTVSPADAAAAAGARPDAVTVAMYGDRPVYRFAGGGRNGRGPGAPMVFADTGEVFGGVTQQQAEAIARHWEPGYTGTVHYDGYVTEPDQWTLQSRGAMPMHRFALDDDAGTRLYVSEASGELVLRTTSRERFWGYLGPVIHWVYFTPLRKNGQAWTQFVIWSSLIGCVMCVTGIVWGLMRFSPSARFRMKGEHVRSPYTGWMKWHHIAGLLFGVIALTWTYSGLLSMGPFDWFQPTGGRGRQQRESGAGGGRASREPITLDDVRAGYAAMATAFVPKSLELTRLQGQRYWVADRAPSLAEADAWRSPSLNPRAARPRLERRYVSVAAPADGPFASFPRESMNEVAREAMPGVKVADAVWLNEFDGYYYDPSGSRSLPVLRVRYADPQETWLYLDPARGGVVQRSEKITRLRRWLYQGLHSLDFPAIYFRRPLWDIIVIVLSLGGLVLSITTFTPAWRRIAFHVRRPFVALSRRRATLPGAAADPL